MSEIIPQGREPDALSVADLVRADFLGLEVLAGRSGQDRTVLWAHTCELHDPAQWLGPNELLMTVGLCVPVDPDEQVDFIDKLAAAGLAGMIVGDQHTKPEISERMLRRADEHGFPVILAAARTPYAAIARMVAAANSNRQTMQVLRLSKLYQVAAAAGDDPHALLDALQQVLSVQLGVRDRDTSVAVLGRASPEPGRRERAVALDTVPASDLIIGQDEEAYVDAFTLVHLRTVVGVAAARALDDAGRRAADGRATLGSLLRGAGHAEASARLAAGGVADGYRVIAASGGAAGSFARAMALAHVAGFAGEHGDGHVALVPLPAMTSARELLAPMAEHVGVSSVYSSFDDVRHAANEAERAREAAELRGEAWVDYEGVSVTVLTRSVRESEAVVDGVLGALAADDVRTRALRETLFAFLRHDRNWKSTAAHLGIHRQTLAYRLGRAEELSGLDLSRMGDLSAAWVAMHAWPVAMSDRPREASDDDAV